MRRAILLLVLVAILATVVIVPACQPAATERPAAADTTAIASSQTPLSQGGRKYAAPATGTTLEKVRIAQIFSTGALGPYWVAKDEGILAKYGIDAETILVNGLQPAVAALNSGQIDGLFTHPALSSLSAAARGMDIALVLTFSNQLAYQLIARPEIRAVKDLKGKKLAVNRIGDSEYYLTRDALAKLGVKPDDVEYQTVGLMPERVATLVQGIVDATTLTAPTDLIAKRQGKILLADLGELGIPYVGNSLHIRRSLAKEKPLLVENMSKALAEAMYVFRTNREVATRAIKTNMKLDDRELLEHTWYAVAKNLEKVPLPDVEGLREVITLNAFEDPLLASLATEKVVDSSFVKKIDASGFVSNLDKDTTNRAARD